MELAAESPRNDIISNGDVVFEYPMSARVEMVLASLGGPGLSGKTPGKVQAAEPAAGAWLRVAPCCSPQGVKKIIALVFGQRKPVEWRTFHLWAILTLT